MIKQVIGVGTALAVAAVGMVFGYRRMILNSGPQGAAAAPETSRVITLGAENAPPVEPGKVLIAPITPKQMPPRMADAKATEPAATRTPPAAASPVSPAPATAAKPKATLSVKRSATKPTTQPARSNAAKPQAAAPKKARVIALQGDGRAAAADAGSSKLTAQERATLAMVQQLHTLRNGILVFRARHNGQAPDFVAGPVWEQFVSRDGGAPVLTGVPTNPLNGQSRVMPVSIEPTPGDAVKGPFGYVYAVRSGNLYAVDGMGRIFDERAVDAVALESKGVRELSAKDQERYLLGALEAVRGQIALYASQHNGRPPEFAKYPAFEQLMKPTLADGTPVDGAVVDGRQTFGPYILSMPINPLNGRHTVAVAPGEVRPGQRVERSDAGFVFSVSTNRFYATDANGLIYDEAKARAGYVPADAGGTGAAAAKQAGVSPVQVLRSAIALYQQHHNGRLPDMKRYPRWEQLTGKTRSDGTPDPTGPCGPYLFAAPVNSRNNSSEVDVVRKLPKEYKPAKAFGYVFETSTGTIWLTDEFGKVVAD